MKVNSSWKNNIDIFFIDRKKTLIIYCLETRKKATILLIQYRLSCKDLLFPISYRYNAMIR